MDLQLPSLKKHEMFSMFVPKLLLSYLRQEVF